MNIERGLRRIASTLSLALAIVALAITADDVYKTFEYIVFNKDFVACKKAAEHWNPALDDFKQLREDARPGGAASGPPSETMSDAERSRWTKAARDYSITRCGDILPGVPKHLDRAIAFWREIRWLPLWATSPSRESYNFAVFLLAWGLVASSMLAALPWGVFYLARWLFRGFSHHH